MIRWTTRQRASHGAGEDRLAVWQEEDTLFVVVCDGAGGIPGGARAADLAMAALVRGVPRDPCALLAAVDDLLEADPLAGECTAVVVRAQVGRVQGASCGDSAAFLDGVSLTDRQHRKRRLGSGRALPVAFEGEGDRLLVCTDGLSGVVRGERLLQALSEPRLARAAGALVAAARLPTGELTDDLALVLADLR